MRLLRSLAASGVLFAALVIGSIAYTATGGAARDLLVQELLINLVLVLGLQAFTGTTGILSFGHLAFAQIAAYATALAAIPVATKASTLPDLPFGIGDVELGSLGATVAGVVVAVALGAAVGVAVARAGGLAATMITLAVLFVVDQGVKNWQELTPRRRRVVGHPPPRDEHLAVARGPGHADRRQRLPGDARRSIRDRHPGGRDRRPGDRHRPLLAAVDGVGPERGDRRARRRAARAGRGQHESHAVHPRRRCPAAGDAGCRGDANRHRGLHRDRARHGGQRDRPAVR